jgi:hypothetical protein
MSTDTSYPLSYNSHSSGAAIVRPHRGLKVSAEQLRYLEAGAICCVDPDPDTSDHIDLRACIICNQASTRWRMRRQSSTILAQNIDQPLAG